MARKFKTTAIASTVKAPISKRSLTHINTAWDELGEDIVRGLLGTYTTNDVIVLYGCVVTANIPGTSSVTAGAIYYNGRIYKVDANASISTPSNTLVWSIIETTITGDPATFSDGSSEDFHIIEKFRLTNAATGTGLADYNAATVKQELKTNTYTDLWSNGASFASGNGWLTCVQGGLLTAERSFNGKIRICMRIQVQVDNAAAFDAAGLDYFDFVLDSNWAFNSTYSSSEHIGIGAGSKPAAYSVNLRCRKESTALRIEVRSGGATTNADQIICDVSIEYNGA